MNGLTEIKVGGVTFPLLFGVKATQYIAERLSEDFTDDPFEINKRLIYAGLLNYASYKDIPKPDMTQAYEICEALFDQEDATEQIEKISNTFAESKHGSKFITKLEEAKKKVMIETEAVANSIGMTLEDTP